MGNRIGLGVLAAVSALGLSSAALAAPTALKASTPHPAPAPAAAPAAPAPAPAASVAAHPAATAATAPPGASVAAAAPGASVAAAASGGPAAPGASGSARADDKEKPWAKLTKLQDRLDALRGKLDERKKTFEDRRKTDRERVKVRWGAVATFPAVREELRLHAMRMARLQRIQELAEVENKAATVERAKKAIDRENARHEKRMTELASRPGANVGAGAGVPAGGAQ